MFRFAAAIAQQTDHLFSLTRPRCRWCKALLFTSTLVGAIFIYRFIYFPCLLTWNEHFISGWKEYIVCITGEITEAGTYAFKRRSTLSLKWFRHRITCTVGKQDIRKYALLDRIQLIVHNFFLASRTNLAVKLKGGFKFSCTLSEPKHAATLHYTELSIHEFYSGAWKLVSPLICSIFRP